VGVERIEGPRTLRESRRLQAIGWQLTTLQTHNLFGQIVYPEQRRGVILGRLETAHAQGLSWRYIGGRSITLAT
jgi:hypothetical protein